LGRATVRIPSGTDPDISDSTTGERPPEVPLGRYVTGVAVGVVVRDLEVPRTDELAE